MKEPSSTCHPPLARGLGAGQGRIRNRDLTMREYTRWVQVKRPPLVMRLAAPKSVVLATHSTCSPPRSGVTRANSFELTVHIGDALPDGPLHLAEWRDAEVQRDAKPDVMGMLLSGQAGSVSGDGDGEVVEGSIQIGHGEGSGAPAEVVSCCVPRRRCRSH